MKIAFVCPASIPATQFGGIMFLCLDMARELSELGHDVTIYTTDLDFANNPKTFNKKLPRVEIYNKIKIVRSHVWCSISLFYINPGMYFQMMKEDFDVIHTIGIRSFQSIVAAIVSIRKKIPLVISDQGGLTTHPELKQSNIIKKSLFKLQTPIIKWIINHAKKISVANEYEKEIFRNFCDETKIVIVRNGINLNILKTHSTNVKEKFNIKSEFILFLGRFHVVKGIDVLLKAISLLSNAPEMSSIKVVIMGVDFGFESKMMKLIDVLGLNEKVIVIKNPSREDVISAYRECKFLVLPSRWELSPLTPLEGFAFEKTVISTNVHGIPFTIKDKENALLVNVEDFNELANSIIYLVKNQDLCKTYGLSGHKLVQEACNSKKMAEDTLKLYNEIKEITEEK